ncbi:UNC93A protein [Gryllus bimaculatus]|nr:UNC93A protein [Gryllus bimaculatus]
MAMMIPPRDRDLRGKVKLSRNSYRKKGSEGAEGAGQPSALELLAATVKLLRRRRLLLLVPVFFFFGAEKAFVGAEFTAGYVSCVSGVASIGYVMICYGLTNSGASAAAGWLNARVGRRRLMAATVALHAALLAVLLAWEPRAAAASSRAVLFSRSPRSGRRRRPLARPDQHSLAGPSSYHLFVTEQLTRVLSRLPAALVSHLFPGDEEAAFSNYHLWESAGYIAAYGYSAHLCVYVKLYILAALLVGGALAFAAIELLLLRSKRRAKALCEHDAL